jgi:hypothetical protein
MCGVLSKSISMRPSAIVEPVGKLVSIFSVGCCGHIVLDCVGIVGQLYNTLVRKIGPRSNKIKQMQKQNTEDTQYKRDTDLRGSPSVGYVHQRNCQVLPLLLSSK